MSKNNGVGIVDNGDTELAEAAPSNRVAKAVRPAKAKAPAERIEIKPPNIQQVTVKIIGTAPYVQCRFSQKAINMIREKQEAGSQANKKRSREAKDFHQCFLDAQHLFRTAKGELANGIPAMAFKAMMRDACRTAGLAMTCLKQTVFVVADGLDVVDETGLIQIHGAANSERNQPFPHEGHVKLASGVADIRHRPMWEEGWHATIRVKYDADFFTASDVCNLLSRGGMTCGIGEGRATAPDSCGMNWGFFRLAGEGE